MSIPSTVSGNDVKYARHILHHSRLDGKPPGPNCGGLYPSAVEGCREYFSTDVVGAVNIGVHGSTPFDAVPTAIPATREVRFVTLLLAVGRVVCWEHIAIQEAGTAGVGFFGEQHRNAHQLGFVGEQLDEPGMGNLHEFLIVAMAQLHPLLPEWILANDERTNSFLHQQINDATAGRMQIVHHPAIALRRDSI